VVFSSLNFRGRCVKQEGLEPFDLRLDAYRTGLRHHATWAVHAPDGSTTRAEFDVEVYDLEHVLELSNKVIRRIEFLVEKTDFRMEALSDPDLLKCLGELNAELYTKRVAEDRTNLREIFAGLLATRPKPSIIVGGVMRLIPWELTTPDAMTGVAGMLGSRALIVGSTGGEPRRNPDGLAVYRPKRRLNMVGVGDDIRVRAIGNMALAGAAQEAAMATQPGKRASGVIAPVLQAGDSKKPFFDHFPIEGYDLVHVFAHCDYRSSAFRLGVSDSVDVTRHDFNDHDVRFPSRAFHFLNVCRAAPTAGRREYAIVDYLAVQQDAGGVVAPLTSVRSKAAVSMASEFYARFLPPAADAFGSSAAEAISGARDALSARGEATGYLYRAFGRHDLVLGPVDKIVEAENV